MNYNAIINQILCDIKTLQTQIVTVISNKIAILWNGETTTTDVTSINFSGNVEVTSVNGITDVIIPENSAISVQDDSVEIEDAANTLNFTGASSVSTVDGLTTIYIPEGLLPAFDANRPITRNVIGLLGVNLGVVGIMEALDELLFPYLAPYITLSAPTSSVFEKQTGNINITVTATPTQNTDVLTELKFYLGIIEIGQDLTPTSGVASSIIHSTPNTDGTTTTPVSQTFSATITDGTTTVTSNTRTRTLVYPYYYGVGAAALSDVQIQALTKLVAIESNKNVTFSPSSQKIYFTYPSSYGGLSQINDGALNITSAFTLRTDTFTQLDGQSVLYNIYESNNLLTVSGYNLNFLI